VSSDIEVIQDLRIFGIEQVGEALLVDLYGSSDCVCGTLIYRFSDASERRERNRLLGEWCRESVPVTYVRRDHAGALLDERSLLQDALRG